MSIHRIVIININTLVDPIPNNTREQQIASIPSQFSSEKTVYSVISASSELYKFLILGVYSIDLFVYNYSGQNINYLFGQLCYIK